MIDASFVIPTDLGLRSLDVLILIGSLTSVCLPTKIRLFPPMLSNMERINAVLIHQGLPQSDRLQQLNSIGITQMKSLLQNSQLKKLK
jgi:hypothetical protein